MAPSSYRSLTQDQTLQLLQRQANRPPLTRATTAIKPDAETETAVPIHAARQALANAPSP